MKNLGTALTSHMVSHNFRVLYGDTDRAGVVYNANYLRYFEIGRTEFLRSTGISYKSLEERGWMLPVVESYLRYKSSAFYDDLLIIKTSLKELSKYSCRFHCHLYNQQNKLLVKGFTCHASTNTLGKLTPLPVNFRDKLRSYL